MQEGIDLCKANVIDFLKDAKLIIAEKRLNHAYVSVEYAIEEFGKAEILKEVLQSSEGDPMIVSARVFKSHKYKDDKAWTILDPKFKTIYDEESDFDDTDFDYKDFQTDTKASHATRLHCAFVDCDHSGWYLGRNLNEELLNNLINHIEERLSRI